MAKTHSCGQDDHSTGDLRVVLVSGDVSRLVKTVNQMTFSLHDTAARTTS